MKEPKVISIKADNGEHSNYALINVGGGEKLWSEAPEECAAMGFPVDPAYDCTCGAYSTLFIGNCPTCKGKPVFV